jgi:hypothetical protein
LVPKSSLQVDRYALFGIARQLIGIFENAANAPFFLRSSSALILPSSSARASSSRALCFSAARASASNVEFVGPQIIAARSLSSGSGVVFGSAGRSGASGSSAKSRGERYGWRAGRSLDFIRARILSL